MRIIKTIIIIVLFIGSLLLAYAAISKVTGMPGIKSLFKKESSVIENTPIIVREMKKIAQLLTQRYYDECIVDSVVGDKIEKASEMMINNPILLNKGLYLRKDGLVLVDKRYVLIASGLVKAGFDLQRMDENDIKVFKDSISCTLPAPEVTDVIINPSGFETFEEEGFWTFNERKAIQQRAKSRLKSSAIQKGILEKSREQGIRILQRFFKSLGYEKVYIEVVKA